MPRMAITLSALEEAMFQALARISPAAAAPTPSVPSGTARTINGAPVRYIGRWTGEPIRSAAIPDGVRASIMRECDNRTPAVLISFDGEVPEPSPVAVRTLSGRVETVGRSTWSVLVVVRDSRATRVLLQGTPAGSAPTLGVLDGEQLVEEAMTNRSIEGLWGVSGVRWVDTTPFMVTPGEGYILRMRYSALRVLADVRDLGYDPSYDTDADYREASFDANLYPPGMAGDLLGSSMLSGLLRTYPGASPTFPDPPRRALLARFDASAVMGVDDRGDALAAPSVTQTVPLWTDRERRWVLAEADTDAQPVAAAGLVLFAAGTRLGALIDWLPVGTRARTLVVLFRAPTTTGVALQYLAGYGSTLGTSTAGEFALALYADGSALRVGLTVDGSTVLLEGPDTAASAEWLVIASYDGTTATLRAVGSAPATDTTDSVAVILETENSRRFELGRAGSLNASLREVLVYREALDSTAQTDLLAYSTERYGV